MVEDIKVIKAIEEVTFVEDQVPIKKFSEGIQKNPDLQGEIAQALAQVKSGDQIIIHPDGIQIIPNNGVKPENNTSKESTT